MKRCLVWILSALLVLPLAVPAFAEPVSEEPVPREPGYCGEAIQWKYENGVLTFTGSGRMDEFYAGQPWAGYRGELREVKIADGITYVGAYAFPDYDALTSVDFGSSLTEVGQGAFSGCDGLTEISLPRSFKIFGEESFSHCKNLKEIHFEGGFPKFKLNCMWDTYAKLIYPAQRPWPLEHIQQLEEAFQGRIEFLASDGTDPYVPEAETEPPAPETTAATQPPVETVPETTAAPETQPPVTVPPTTEAPAPVETRAPETVPPTTEGYVELLPPEEEPREPEEKDSKIMVIALIVLMVLSGGGALLLIGRMSRNHRKDFAGDFSEILLEDERKEKRNKTSAAGRKTGSSAKAKQSGKYRKK